MDKDYHDIRRDFTYNPDIGELYMVLNKTEPPQLITTEKVKYKGKERSTLQIIFIYVTGDRFAGMRRIDKNPANNKWSNFTHYPDMTKYYEQKEKERLRKRIERELKRFGKTIESEGLKGF